jgi:RecA/RadA recombinase
MKVSKIKDLLKTEKPPMKDKKYLSTGSMLLNLACSGTIYGGFEVGTYNLFVGDSSSGKTFFALTCFAEACKDPYFKDYRIIYDNTERGARMDVKKFFGAKTYDRLEPPKINKNKEACYSETIEEFYYNMDNIINDGRPFIYVLDSMDSISSKDELSKFEETKKAFYKGREVAGSYGDGKAKKNSANLRRLIAPLDKMNSILIIINQTRDNMGFGFEKKTFSGGNALTFYSCLLLWSSIKKKIKKTVKGKPRQIGVICKLQIKKNRQSGRDRVVFVPIYYSVGIDEIGSCVDYLLEESHWSKKSNEILAKEFDFKGSREKLIHHIEKGELEKDLFEIVNDVWNEIEGECEVKRKQRYE